MNSTTDPTVTEVPTNTSVPDLNSTLDALNSTISVFNSTVAAAKPTYSIGDQVGSIAVVIIMAAFAGLLMGALSGFEIPKIGTWIKGYKVKALFTKVKLPPIVAMIIMGCIVRNFFGSAVKLAYPDTWAQWIRTCCLAILLVRGGLQVTFTGKGIIVVLLSLVPLAVEAVT